MTAVVQKIRLAPTQLERLLHRESPGDHALPAACEGDGSAIHLTPQAVCDLPNPFVRERLARKGRRPERFRSHHERTRMD